MFLTKRAFSWSRVAPKEDVSRGNCLCDWGLLEADGAGVILKESFKLTDQGERELGLRYDLTVPLARVVGMNPSLKMPFKR